MTQLWVGSTELWDGEDHLLNAVVQQTGIRPKSVWFCRNQVTGHPEGYGFIDFNSPSEAAEVLRLLKDTPVPQNPKLKFKLRWGTQKNTNDPDAIQQSEGYSVYIGSFPTSVTEQQLLEFFKRYNPDTINAKIIVGPDGISKGFGFVKFNTYAEMQQAIKRLNGNTEFGKSVRVSEATGNRVISTDSDSNNNVLFLRGIDPEIVTEAVLIYNFSKYGNVVTAKISINHPDWATVTMETHAAAESAKNSLQGTRFGGTTKVDIQYGRPVDETQTEKITPITVPIMKPTKINKKLQAEFFDDSGLEKVIDIFERYAVINRDITLVNSNSVISNRIQSSTMLDDSFTYDWCSYSDSIPNSFKTWYF